MTPTRKPSGSTTGTPPIPNRSRVAATSDNGVSGQTTIGSVDISSPTVRVSASVLLSELARKSTLTRRSPLSDAQAAAPLTVPLGSRSIVISVTPAPTYFSRAGRPNPINSRWIGALPANIVAVSWAIRSRRAHATPSVSRRRADALVLELFGNGDRDFRGPRPVGLQAEVPDDQVLTAAIRIDDRDEPLPMVVIGSAEGGALRWRRTDARMQEPRAPTLIRQPAVEPFQARPNWSSGSPGLERRVCSDGGGRREGVEHRAFSSIRP